MSYLEFENHALPVLIELSESDPGESFRLASRLEATGLSSGQVTQTMKMLLDDKLITADYQQNAGGNFAVFANPQLTPKALKTIGVWPAEDEAAHYLLRRLADGLDQLSESEGDDESAGRMKQAGTVLREVSTKAAAAIIAGGIVG